MRDPFRFDFLAQPYKKSIEKCRFIAGDLFGRKSNQFREIPNRGSSFRLLAKFDRVLEAEFDLFCYLSVECRFLQGKIMTLGPAGK